MTIGDKIQMVWIKPRLQDNNNYEHAMTTKTTGCAKLLCVQFEKSINVFHPCSNPTHVLTAMASGLGLLLTAHSCDTDWPQAVLGQV